MSSMSHGLLPTNILLLLTILNLFLLPILCVNNYSPLSSPKEMLMEDKIRLGSTPPTCHNCCNACNPCTAVQVPTLPGRADPGLGGGNNIGVHSAIPLDSQFSYNKDANYKPLGWKCRCGDRLYNP